MISRKIYYLFSSLRNLDMSESELRDFQEKNLENIVSYAADYSSFYRSEWLDSFVPDEFDGLSDLEKIPVADRNKVRENQESVKTMIREHTAYNSTGSLGERFTVTFDEQAADWREAITVRTELLKGYRPFQTIVELTGNPQTRIGGIFRPKRPISGDKSIQEQIDILKSERPDYLIYGGHILFRICKELRSQGVDLQVKGVFNNGELLTPNMRDYIEETLQTEIFSVYETSEVGQIAYECPEGGFHVNQDLVHLEVLDDNQEPVENGERGKAVVTGLVNRSFPVIRYDIGDIVVKGERNCSCKTGFKKIKRIEGRADNLMVNDRGEEVTPYEIVDVLAGVESLRKFVFVKEEGNFSLRYSPGDGFDGEVESDVKNKLSDLGFNSVKMVETSSIERKAWKAAPVRNLDQ